MPKFNQIHNTSLIQMNKYNFHNHTTSRTSRKSGHYGRYSSGMSNFHTRKNDSFKRDNEHIGKETQKILMNGIYRLPSSLIVHLKRDIERCTEDTKYYPHCTSFPRPISDNLDSLENIFFSEDIGLSICYDIVSDPSHGHKKVCLLNCGSPIEPCRGFEIGENGQECDIARKTILFSSLRHAKKSRSMNCGFFKKSDCYVRNGYIFSPGVSIIRNSDNELISPTDKSIDIITASAVNMNYNVPDKRKVLKTMEEKISAIIDIARYHGEEILVLCAFGCGRNGNDPRAIANIFKKVLIDEENSMYFEEVYFSIIDRKARDVFKVVFN